MKPKLIHGVYEANAAFRQNTNCTECDNIDVDVVEFCAEANAGEYYVVNVCENCLKEVLNWFKG